MPAQLQTEAIILKHFNYGEAGRILTVLTPRQGKINVLAKGVRRLNSRMRAGVQLFCYSQLAFYQGRSLHTLVQCQPRELFKQLREDYSRFTYACYLTEIIERFTVEAEDNPALFVLLLTSLHLLAYRDPFLAARFFELKFLSLVGYKPELESCVLCRSNVKESRKFFAAASGGIACSRCAASVSECLEISSETLAILQKISASSPRFLFRLKFSYSCRSQLQKVIPFYLQYQLGKRLKSLSFLEHLSEKT